MTRYCIRPISENELPAIVEFADRWIGRNYFSEECLREILSLSKRDGICCSFGAWSGDELAGIRLTYAPGTWVDKNPRGLTPQDWKVKSSEAAYFKSLFISGDHQKRGLGKSLSRKSLEQISALNGRAVLCHSWLESPGNSSQKYLQSMGFESVRQHEKFWYPIDYKCVRCAPSKCTCTALEMIKYL